ncbi:MAG TPA: folylpolyglutamate synthase/dihydrofolate synthase family protein [Acidimicrobiia bacterium]|nr:folylpolyglutamate synthase/dihydrofolate synthase family protein [Acidimicrobiia bacterium]
MNYDDAVAYLDAHIGRGMVPGVERITALLELMGNPQDAYPIIHVAGTNGKTSVTRMATLLCIAHGLSTGTFISPHLERVEERFAVNGRHPDGADFVQAVVDVRAFADIFEERMGESLTYFELTAALAVSWFADQAVDAAVIEVGLGGRLDATNVVHGEVAVLTSVGIEHTEYLGDTLEQIAEEKLAIVEEGATLVTGPLPQPIERLARRTAARLGINAYVYGSEYTLARANPALGGWNLDIQGIHGLYEDIYLPVHGRFQTINLAVALAATEALVGRELDHEAVIDGVAAFSAPGRMEPVATKPMVMIDAAHNAPGFEILGHALAEEFANTKWVLVIGAMEDKDVVSMIGSVRDRVSRIVTTAVDADRAISATDLAAIIAPHVDVEVGAIDDPTEAVEVARTLAGEDGAVLVAGSIYLGGTIRAHLAGRKELHRRER